MRRTAFFVIASVTASPVAASAGRLGGGSSPDISLIRILAALVLCALVAFAAVAIMKARSGQPLRFSIDNWRSITVAAPRRVEIVETRRLSLHADVCLMRCDGQEYLLACGPGGVVVLDTKAVPPTSTVPLALVAEEGATA